MGCVAAQPMSEGAIERLDLADTNSLNVQAEETFHRNFMLGSKLGKGAFSQVRRVTRIKPSDAGDVPNDWATNQVEAVKILNLLGKNGNASSALSLQNVAKREVRVWRAIGDHPNCVCLNNHFFGNVFYYMVLEKCEMSLLEALEKMPDLTERGLGNVTAQMLLGVAHTHRVGVIHRDIKPDNFLVGGKDGETVKLTDFGLSVMVPQSGAKLSGVFGTAPFMCPEMINNERYDTKADLWSVGVIVYTLLFGTFPYQPKDQPSAKAMKQAISAGIPPSFLPARKFGDSTNGHLRTGEAVKLVKDLLNRNPKSRLSADEALLEPWMTSSLEGLHRPDADLPSLRPMLHAAKRNGAFELRDLSGTSSDDMLLSHMQQQCRSSPSPTPTKDKKQSWDDISNLSTSFAESSNGGSDMDQVASDKRVSHAKTTHRRKSKDRSPLVDEALPMVRPSSVMCMS